MKLHGYVRMVVRRWVEPVRKPDPADKNFMVDDYEVVVELLNTESFQTGFTTRKGTHPDWVGEEISEFGEQMAKDILDKPSYDEIRKGSLLDRTIDLHAGLLNLKVVDTDPLPEELPSDACVEIVGEFWYWGGMTFNGESEEYDSDSELRNVQLRVLTAEEAKYWEPCDGTNCRKSCCKAYDGEMVQLT